MKPQPRGTGCVNCARPDQWGASSGLRAGRPYPGSSQRDPRGFGVGVDLMFGHVVGEATEDPVLLIRFATNHQTWFRRGSRSLGHHYLSPSGGGGLDLDGSWDVIHFNHGVWDQASLDPATGKRAEPGQGRIRTSIEDYEKNLRTIVARLKQTGATLIWAHTTPILEGTPPGYVGGEMVDKYNAVAAKVMEENGVIINDLNADCQRSGKPEKLNVHDVGDLSPKVTEVVKAALDARENPSRPIPRVLFIGDSITGSYWEKVQSNPNVASIDTVPFYFPTDQSPGGREWDFHRNAESYLKIGEAAGKAMRELQQP